MTRTSRQSRFHGPSAQAPLPGGLARSAVGRAHGGRRGGSSLCPALKRQEAPRGQGGGWGRQVHTREGDGQPRGAGESLPSARP